MVSLALVLVLVSLWTLGLSEGCGAEELSREDVLSWFSERVLEGLGLDKPPLALAHPEGGKHTQATDPRTSRTTLENHQTGPVEDRFQIILFPSPDTTCFPESTRGHFKYNFQPSLNEQEVVVTEAHFWFYAGQGVNASAPLFILPSEQQLLQAAEAPSRMSPDRWSTYDLEGAALASVARGPFMLQVSCPACQCHADQPDKMPFLDLHAQPRAQRRFRRHTPLNIPWSPSAIDLLQHPSQERPEHSDCQRVKVEISFEELGWANWIIHPTILTFYYCHGNCSAQDRTATMLGISQCCAPVPGSMRSLRITTTSDGGYSYKYETLPNIIPEECTCI